MNAKTVTAAVVRNVWQLRRNERAPAHLMRFIRSGGERNEVEASENQTTYQQMSETKRSEAKRLSSACALRRRTGRRYC